jgi:predicted Rossmann fold nucleotide-binding protein DprA/Smf involved in DNA uptake
MDTISEDAKTILLLCGNLGQESACEPLDLREYNLVVRWLMAQELRPADLLTLERVPALAQGTGIAEERLLLLLKRGVRLGFAVEKWDQSGIWVICRSDPEYPVRYKAHLKDKAPAILFGVGKRALLQGGGLAIVGSRNVDVDGEAFAREVAEWCARNGLPVVSGGARGVDQVAMNSALEAGGKVVGVLADTLLRKSVSAEARDALAGGKLLLISPYHPEAGFNVGNAMGRNKLIYALADYGVVVSADHLKGGTWAGAVEELKRQPGRTVFVRLSDTVPLGNRKLVELGAMPFPSITAADDPAEVLQTKAKETTLKPESGKVLSLFDQPINNKQSVIEVREKPHGNTEH